MNRNSSKYLVFAVMIIALLGVSVLLAYTNCTTSQNALDSAARLEDMVSESDATIADLEKDLLALENKVSDSDLLIAEYEKSIAELNEIISASDATIAEQQKTIEELEARIEELTKPKTGGGGGGGGGGGASNSGDNLGAWTEGWD